jgi:hypothetical protein
MKQFGSLTVPDTLSAQHAHGIQGIPNGFRAG